MTGPVQPYGMRLELPRSGERVRPAQPPAVATPAGNESDLQRALSEAALPVVGELLLQALKRGQHDLHDQGTDEDPDEVDASSAPRPSR